MLAVTTLAGAADVPITGLKLIVVDKMIAAGRAKTVFVSKDGAITKGTGTDPGQIEATLGVAFDSASGAFDMPQGGEWLLNNSAVAKYVHTTAPAGGAVKVGTIKPGAVVKIVGKSLGDTPLSITSAPVGPVYVVDTVVNGGEMTRLCAQFTGCAHKAIAGGTGHKLVCRGSSAGDPVCVAATPECLAPRFVDQSLTVSDNCTGLEWEKKTSEVGSGPDASDLHDVDNKYTWAGHCSLAVSKRCQPNLAAETACKGQTEAAYWGDGCEQCVGGEGICTLAAQAITTVWDWLNQVNAANYAGHGDWRLPFVADQPELESLLTPCVENPCIDPIFGPTQPWYYWSASTDAAAPTSVRVVWFFGTGGVHSGPFGKENFFHVRAVRDGP